MSLSLRSLPLSVHPRPSLHLAAWGLHSRTMKPSVVVSECLSPAEAVGDPAAESLAVVARKLWIFPSRPLCPGPCAQRGSSLCFLSASITWRWASYFFLTADVFSVSLFIVYLSLLYGMTWKMNLKCHLFFFFSSFKYFLLSQTH